jgi:hypothetical protein
VVDPHYSAKHDARQWASKSGDADPTADVAELGTGEGEEGDECVWRLCRLGDIGNATRLIDVLRSSMGANQITAGSNVVRLMVQQLCEFQQVALCSSEDLLATEIHGRGTRTTNTLELEPTEDADVPRQDKVKSIKSQQSSASRERERMIKGIQEQAYSNADSHSAATLRVLSGFGQDDISIIPSTPEAEIRPNVPSTSLRLGPSASFSESGKLVAKALTLNRRQSIAFRLLCHQVDRVHRN